MKNKDKEKNITVLGKETAFRGVLKFRDILHIEGSFTGDIDSTGFLYVAKDAVCEVGHINIASIVVEGTVRGSINATGDVELKPHSNVIGDIVALRLKIADDVSFSGAIHMLNGIPSTADDIFAMDVSSFRESLKKSQEKDETFKEEKPAIQEEDQIQESFSSQEKLIQDIDDSEW